MGNQQLLIPLEALYEKINKLYLNMISSVYSSCIQKYSFHQFFS